MGIIQEALARLRSTTDRAIEFADPSKAIAEAQDKFHELVANTLDNHSQFDASAAIEHAVASFQEHVVQAIESIADRVTKLEKAALTPSELPPAPPEAPAPSTTPVPAPTPSAADDIAAAALAAAGGASA